MITRDKNRLIVFLFNLVALFLINFHNIYAVNTIYIYGSSLGAVLYMLIHIIVFLITVTIVAIFSYIKLRKLSQCIIIMVLSVLLNLIVVKIGCIYFNNRFGNCDQYIETFIYLAIVLVFELLVYIICKLIDMIVIAIRKRRL